LDWALDKYPLSQRKTVDPRELELFDATDQARLCRSGEVTALELVEAAIARVERLNPALNTVVTPMFESAMAAAGSPSMKGPLSGVPVMVKDLIASVAHVPLTNGSVWLRNYIPSEDSESIRRWRAAGLIFHL
jgi:amidase